MRNRIGDVVELEIEKHLLAGSGQRVRVGKPAGEGELIADLVEGNRVAQAGDQGLRRFD